MRRSRKESGSKGCAKSRDAGDHSPGLPVAVLDHSPGLPVAQEICVKLNLKFNDFPSEQVYNILTDVPADNVITFKEEIMAKTVSFPVIDLKSTGSNIESCRREAGLSVRELQDYFGFEYPQAIYKWQHGECLPTVDNLLALSRILEVKMEDLLVYEDQEVSSFCGQITALACRSRPWITARACRSKHKPSV